jgi:hypothetical protein
MIYEYGEPWRNGIDRGKVVIHPPEFSGNLASRSILAKEIMNLAFEISLFILRRDV